MDTVGCDFQLGENCTETVLVGGVREATESTRWKNFRRQGAMKRRRDRQASLSWLMVDCLPSGLNHDLWLTGGGRGEGGKEGGLEWELHKTSSSLGDCSSHSLMIKNRGSVFPLHTMPCCFFVFFCYVEISLLSSIHAAVECTEHHGVGGRTWLKTKERKCLLVVMLVVSTQFTETVCTNRFKPLVNSLYS